MRVGSLFSGIGGLELGLERAGMEVVWQVERDAYCRRVLAKHWPDVTRYEDVHDVGRSNLAHVDLICGGFPCQDISAAGNGAGIIKGNRSGLWYEFARIIRELRPRYVVVENVPVLTSRGLGIVLGDLADAGYDAEWGCVSAAAVGAPHLRKRIFIVAHSQSDGRRQGVTDGRGRSPRARARQERGSRGSGTVSGEVAHTESAGPQGLRSERQDTRRGDPDGHARPSGMVSGEVADTARCADFRARATRRVHDNTPKAQDSIIGVDRSGGRQQPSEWWIVEPDLGRVAHGVPARVDRLRALGNAVVPQVAEWIGQRIIGKAKRRKP